VVKKSNIIALVCIIAAIGVVSLSVVTFAAINQNETRGGSYVNSHSSDFPHFQGVTKSNGYYNISLAFSNVTDPERLDNILINPNSQENITDLTFYLNGTTVNAANPASYNLKSGDSLQVNFTVSSTEFTSGSTMLVYVMGDNFGWNTGVVLP
jgi:hypothetical protein